MNRKLARAVPSPPGRGAVRTPAHYRFSEVHGPNACAKAKGGFPGCERKPVNLLLTPRDNLMQPRASTKNLRCRCQKDRCQ